MYLNQNAARLLITARSVVGVYLKDLNFSFIKYKQKEVFI